MIDLHLHTTYSDGASETEDLVREALAFKLQAMAITDHDNTQSYAIALEAAKGTDLEIIPGIEINTVWAERETEVHVLGYYIDTDNKALQKVIKKHQEARVEQIREIAGLLQGQGGLAITFEDIQAQSRDLGSLGRPHIAQTIVEKEGAATISEAFSKYLKRNSSTYVRRSTVSPHEAAEAISESGGIPVIAHPGDMEHIEQLVVEMMDYGLRGLEAYHRSHFPATIEFHCGLAEKYGLIVTGGTDYHGMADSYQNALSRLHTPDYVYAELKKEHQQRHKASFKVS